jgi:MSHA biogenesis protein MshP
MKPMAKIAYKLQRGFSLVTAIFLLVVLSALGAMMVTFFTAQQQSSAVDVLGSRAYQAARAGVEWAALGVSQTASGVLWVGCATGATFPANTLGGMLTPFSVTVTCINPPVSAVDGVNPIWVYDITAAASGVNGALPGNANYVERVINVKMGH